MTIRQRSPQNSTSAEPTYQQQTTFQHQDSNNSNMSWQEMRARNPDGSSTVYRVHDSMNNNCGVQQQQQPYHTPGVTVVGGGGMHQQHQQGGVSYGGGGVAVGGNEYMYGQPPPSMYSPYNNPHAQSPVVIVQNETPAEESDDEEDPTPATSPSSSSSRSRSSHPESSKPQRHCSRNTPLCMATGIILGISFIIGYAFFIDAIVEHARSNKRGGGAHASARANALRSANYPQVPGAQPQLMPQYFVLKPVDASDVPVGAVVQQPRSIVDGSGGGGGVILQQQEESEQNELSTVSRHGHYPHVKDGPLRKK